MICENHEIAYTYSYMRKFILAFILIVMNLGVAKADVNLIGRLGMGYTNQLANNMEAISFKVQRSRSSALGVVLGFKS